jgi:hypothetical protein
MQYGKRDLLVLLKPDAENPSALDGQLACIHEMLMQVERSDIFCGAHELVARNRITRKPRKILKAVSFVELRPFEFLINKN